ncbi:MAG: hypothetical protein E6G81_08320 [Alphaproteobacteria bacterium]|nr:MAG: hypothetical protein E6G81_08320 [Alphaproteobacteria bacterium]
MLKGSGRTFAALAFAAGLTALVGGFAPRTAMADDKELAQALRAGGLVLIIRHGATRSDEADADPVEFDNIAAQRNLNDKGPHRRTRTPPIPRLSARCSARRHNRAPTRS